MKKQLIILSIAAMTSGAVFAAGAPVANQFSAGQPARAAEVNANFQELADRTEINTTNISTNTSGISTNATGIATNVSGISTNAAGVSTNAAGIATNATGITGNTAEIDVNTADIASNATDIASSTTAIDTNTSGVATNAADISSNIAEIDTNIADISTNATDIAAIDADLPSVKNYLINENLLTATYINQTPVTQGQADLRVDTYVFDTGSKTFDLSIDIKNSNDQSVLFTFGYAMSYEGEMSYSSHTSAVVGGDVYTYSHTPSRVIWKEKMRLGESWGEYSDTTRSVNGGAPTAHDGSLLKKTFLGYQDVSVTAGEFADCVVIQRESQGSNNDSMLGGEILFYCDGAGLVRQISLGGGSDWQLENYTTK